MARIGFYYDQEKCIGCNACQMACKDQNNLEAGLFFRRAETIELYKDNKLECWHFSGACNHCDDSECITQCPTGAMERGDDGTVIHHKEKCIGCGICTKVCPYGAPKLRRLDGRSSKCELCFDRRKNGLNPACVDACLTHCLQVVDYDQVPNEMKRMAVYPWESSI